MAGKAGQTPALFLLMSDLPSLSLTHFAIGAYGIFALMRRLINDQ
jgi:hypothetical protein